ncbi:TPA: translation initiation factor IF-2 [Candidatus Ventrenecus stercoripullorum]|nr:translation initiation factor IF-2 [Candidatus Ventrenecus stercoripullorum]
MCIMTVKEYAESVSLSVAEILKKCEQLGIEVKTGDDILEDDDVISLDYATNLISSDSESTYEEEDSMDSLVEDLVASTNVHTMNPETKKQKLKKRSEIESSKSEYFHKRKEMYKHKEKLMNNQVNEDIVLYKNDMTVADLADALKISGTDIIKKLMGLGLMVSLNQPIDFQTAEIITLDYGKSLKKEETQDISNFEEYEVTDQESDLVLRPAVVTIMGHVDHGKTTLLDYIRHSKVVDTEFGGITQHIGAYQILHNGQKLTFIDTPGHAAFTEMRARGASVTDIVIIIVAADDGVMPQTEEAIDHAKSAGVPIVVAVNKIDTPNINIERVMQEMSEHGITPEAWGGDTPFVNISAMTGEGIDLLLETILTISEVNGYKANPNRYAMGTVIESKVDKNVGGVASLLIQNGTLRLGDPVVVGTAFGRVRTMKNDLGESIVEAGPSTPVEITGLSDNPSAGDKFMAFETEAEAKSVAQKRVAAAKENKFKKEVVSLDDLFAKIKSGQKEINVVLKADVRGSEEAVKNALSKIDVEGVRVNVIRSGIGTITESDVVLANASDAIIIGFNVMPSSITKEVAKEYNVDIRLYTIIYKVVEEMELAMKGLLDPEFEEKVLGSCEIRKIFTFSKVGKIAGCYVTDGVIKYPASARVIRDGVIIYDGAIGSIQREKDSVKEVKKGFECGVTLENYSDIKEGDVIECYEMVEIKK